MCILYYKPSLTSTGVLSLLLVTLKHRQWEPGRKQRNNGLFGLVKCILFDSLDWWSRGERKR